jgi:hypothetical protein
MHIINERRALTIAKEQWWECPLSHILSMSSLMRYPPIDQRYHGPELHA